MTLTNASVDRDLVTQLTRELIRFQSVNPPGNEAPVAQHLAGRLEEMGIEVDLDEAEPGRANLVARIRGEGDGHLVFTGHLDVVPPGSQKWQHEPFAADLEGGRIYGRGSADMKGGVASIVAAMDALKQSGFRPKADVVLAATYGEEQGLAGARAMAARKSLAGARYLVVAEPTDLNVFIGEKGVLWVTVRALGRTGHGSMPWLGVNAISYMARLIPRLEEYPFPFEESELLGKPTLSVNMIQGGNKSNVVPDVCEITLDMRTVPSQGHRDIIERLRSVAEDAAREFHPDLRVEIDVIEDVGPLETERTEPLVEAMLASVEAVRSAPRVEGVPYATDAAYLGPGFSIPMVICGPGTLGVMHQPDEYTEVEQLVQAAEIYVDLTQRLLS
ncbi:MAG TPA: M20 family metallopeptidase [Chloroflexota bacterium]